MKINKPVLLLLVCSLLVMPSLSALGKKDASDQKTLNDEWALCITAFDLSALPPARRISGDVITRNLVSRLDAVSYRLRLNPEYAYYEGYAWQQAVSAAAKALSIKQNERSQLLYRGDPNWKYRASLKKIDAEIEKLKETLAEKEAEKPFINHEPQFTLSKNNLSGTYPAPPKENSERRFCRDQNADAFLTGTIREFHGRYYIQLHLFALYTNSWVYEDDIIFSLEDTEGAVDEITGRLTAVLAENKPAMIAVRTEPEEAQILINQSYAGRGIVDARERPPGTVSIAATAEGYSSEIVEMELAPGELAEIAITLSPLHFGGVHINVPGSLSASVYHGALYVGEAPLVLPLPIEQLNYILVETENGRVGKSVFTSPDMPDGEISLSIDTRMIREEKRVNKARRRYYWAWGITWITGIAGWTSYGIHQNQLAFKPADSAFQNNRQVMGYISTGALIAVSAAAVYETFEMVRYLYTSTENVTPIVRQGRKKK